MNGKIIKIFVDAHCFDAEYQGSRTFVKEIYTAMAMKKDVQLFVAAYDVENLKKNFLCAENVVLLKYKSRSPFFRLAYEIPRLIKKHRIEFAHFQYIAPFLKNCKQVVTIHDVIFNDYPDEFPKVYRLLRNFFFQRSAKKAEILTTVSNFSKNSIQKHWHQNPQKIHVVSNGVHHCFFKPYNKQEAKAFIKKKYGFQQFILYVSRIEPRKNHLSLLKAFCELQLYANDYHLVFIGHASIPVPEVHEMMATMPFNAKDFIFWSDSISDEDLLQFYRAADVFIYPSKAEGFGIPPLEAGAARVPVICSNTSAMQEFSFFGPYHIDPSDDENLKHKIAEIVAAKQDEMQLERIANHIQHHYSWEDSAEKLYQLIKMN